MNEVETTVTALEGEYARVAAPKGGCGRCDEKGGCGKQHLNQLFCTSPRTFRVLNKVGAKPGDRVVVAVADNAINISAFLLYGLPLGALVLGAGLGSWIGSSDLAAIAGGISGLTATWAALIILLKRRTGNLFFQPYILSRLPSHEPEPEARAVLIR